MSFNIYKLLLVKLKTFLKIINPLTCIHSIKIQEYFTYVVFNLRENSKFTKWITHSKKRKNKRVIID